MEVEKTGMQTGHRDAYKWPPRVRIENRYACGHCGVARKALAHHKTEIDQRKRGLGPSGPRAAG